MTKVLLADDEAHIRLLFKKVLTQASFEVVAEASNGNEAIELYKSIKPDIVLLDIAMPYKTGTETLIEIMDFDNNACIIMLTSMVDMETVKYCIENGAANYLRKDTPIDKIAELIRETFQQNR